MTWNYRVISHPSWDFGADEGAREYRIHEVFSDETGIIGYSAEGCEPFGESKKDLMIDISYMVKAFEKPVLNVEDMPTTKFGEQNGTKTSTTTAEKNKFKKAEKTTARPTTQPVVVEL